MKKTLSIIGNIIIWVIFVFALCMTIFAIAGQQNDSGVPSIFGKMPIAVLSDSMNPTFVEGDLIFDEELSETEKAELKVDDIITFRADLDNNGTEELNSHRIISVREADGLVFYTTKGDNADTNMKADDNEVLSSDIIGKYTDSKISKLGAILTFLQQPKGFMICVVIPLILFFLFEAFRFIVTLMGMKTQKAEKDEEEIKRRAVEDYIKSQSGDAGEAAPVEADDTKQE